MAGKKNPTTRQPSQRMQDVPMRYLLALALLTCWLQGISGGNELTSRYPLETEFGKLCTVIPVLVSVLDDKDQPVKSAQVLAVSDDWGVRLPVTGDPFAYTDEKGTERLARLPQAR